MAGPSCRALPSREGARRTGDRPGARRRSARAPLDATRGDISRAPAIRLSAAPGQVPDLRSGPRKDRGQSDARRDLRARRRRGQANALDGTFAGARRRQ